MSTIDVLLRQVEQLSPQLAADLRHEVGALSKLRTFGLNFERHRPESVELPGRTVRRGDKVRIAVDSALPAGVQKSQLWHVARTRRADEVRSAILSPLSSVGDKGNEDAGLSEAMEVPVSALVVVAEFSDPIYPGLRSTGRVERGGNKPFHTVINSENFHALQSLLYTHEGAVDAIYIDPPYNTGAKDWKYNNDYVDSEDQYRHSKWLAFMERRLRLAKRLLDPDDSVMVVTIDENEHARLALLLEQVFPEASTVTVSVANNPKGTPESGFARIDEYYLFVMLGNAAPGRVFDPLNGPVPDPSKSRVRWRGLTRTGANGTRAKSPGAYYPIFISKAGGKIHSVGAVPPEGDDGSSVIPPAGTVAVWPTPRPNGELGRWSVVRETLLELLERGAVRTGRVDVAAGEFPLYYLTEANLRAIDDGSIVVTGRAPDGTLVVEYAEGHSRGSALRTSWYRTAHSASEHGTGMMSRLIPGRWFDYAKSLYAVEDSLRPFLKEKPKAVVLDFFAGSGTTAHAVMRLNKQDGGRRQSISVTNNEVSVDEQKKLRAKGLRPGDAEWETLGICEYITKPRITTAITGETPEGEPIQGDYRFTDEFAMADGFDENVEFFDLTYEAPRPIAYDRNFEAIAPLLWLRAGSEGARIGRRNGSPFRIADTYAVLFEVSAAHDFLAAVEDHAVQVVYIVTDDERAFASIASDLAGEVETVRLYESYLTNFTINTGQGG